MADVAGETWGGPTSDLADNVKSQLSAFSIDQPARNELAAGPAVRRGAAAKT